MEAPIKGCAFAPRASSELNDYRQATISGGTLYAPYGSDVQPTDRIRVPAPWAGVYGVEGDIGVWVNPHTGDTPGVEINLEKRAG
ncbi:hypothetical protein LWF01_02960 [Saxibacter everestensis]|uniref:Deoxyuridine 5'-triphosphate nucleotidohydrolase n=1 Tax=Saxibacter everestensis TaxID=2909229 RepID=A0ABY8QWJ1_9MICO|nr:hypothetical protein LWF01_02960 [Brevibacteriaceae bacterium ZFBP1038]